PSTDAERNLPMDSATATATTATATDEGSRPTATLPIGQLIRLSIYWLGLSSIFAGLHDILTGRLQFEGLVTKGHEGEALLQLTIFGAIIAMAVQPTVGSISDYSVSRWGRRKPYIFIGSILDVIFLYGIASSHALIAIAAFVVLLQFSSNFAQGPFQGYVPDLVPGAQVGIASALVGVMSILGVIGGTLVIAAGYAVGSFVLPTIALGLIELGTAIGT